MIFRKNTMIKLMKSKYSIFILFLFLSVSGCSENCKFNSITTDNMPDGVIGQDYSNTINYDITCSYTQKSFTLVKGTLPEGLTLLSEGRITGIPEETGVFKFTVKCKMCFASGSYEFTDCHELTKEIGLVVKDK